MYTIQNILPGSSENLVIYVTIRSEQAAPITIRSRPKVNVRFSFVIGRLIGFI